MRKSIPKITYSHLFQSKKLVIAIVNVLAIQIIMAIVTLLAIETVMTIVTALAIKTDIHSYCNCLGYQNQY